MIDLQCKSFDWFYMIRRLVINGLRQSAESVHEKQFYGYYQDLRHPNPDPHETARKAIDF